MIFKVAILQKRSINRAYNNNTKSVIGYMSEAKKNGADILLLPECYLTGYDLTITNNDAITENDLSALIEAAKKIGIGVTATALTKGNKNSCNTAFIINKDGDIILKYDKVHSYIQAVPLLFLRSHCNTLSVPLKGVRKRKRALPLR